MARQEELFPRPQQTVSVHSSRRTPPLWVRRLQLWSEPGALIRDISFHRGLNVVWSPDPGAPAAVVGQNSDSGHGAGKTLLCRLLRYCLGEATFASEDQRRNIASRFPGGHVGAEVIIGGKLWSIIRPIGTTRRHIVREGVTLEELVETNDAATGVDPLLEALSTVVSPATMNAVIPELREDSSWLFALGWLGRDQENRFDHILDWRHARSDSGSQMPSLAKERVLAGVRALLGILHEQEIEVKNERQNIPVRRQRVDRDLTYLRRRSEELRQELIRRTGLDDAGSVGGPLDLSALQQRAEHEIKNAEQAAMANAFTSRMSQTNTERDRLLQEVAVADEQLKGLIAKSDLATNQMQALKGERTNLTAEEFKSIHGELCPICSVPIDRALAEGCPLSPAQPDAASLADQRENLTARTAACQTAIDRYTGQVKGARTRTSSLKAQLELAEGRLTELKRLADEQNSTNRRRMLDAERFQDDVNEFAALQEQMAKAQRDSGKIDEREKQLLETQTALRDRHADVLRRINELFTYVSRSLLGSDVEASIDLTDQRLQARVQVGGQAMESLKALAFDLASLLMSIEGRAGIPAFLIHDSPREADLGESIYHRLFRFGADLEGLSDEPPFQYIITTTTDPPAEIRTSKRLVLQLSGSRVEERLLRWDFK